MPPPAFRALLATRCTLTPPPARRASNSAAHRRYMPLVLSSLGTNPFHRGAHVCRSRVHLFTCACESAIPILVPFLWHAVSPAMGDGSRGGVERDTASLEALDSCREFLRMVHLWNSKRADSLRRRGPRDCGRGVRGKVCFRDARGRDAFLYSISSSRTLRHR